MHTKKHAYYKSVYRIYMVYNKRKTTKSIPQKPNVYIIINVYTKTFTTKKYAKCINYDISNNRVYIFVVCNKNVFNNNVQQIGLNV